MREDTSHQHIGPQEQVKAIKANDEAVLQALYQDNYRRVERYVLDNSGTAEQARDIYQEAFIAVWRNIQLDRFHPEHATALPAYLYQVAKNKWLDHVRSAYYKKTSPLPGEDPEQEMVAAVSEQEEEHIAAIRKQFRQLGETCQDILTRFYYKKENLRTIAAQMGWTEATARNNKYRCLERLRALVKQNKTN